jgi:hypothetical protein
MASPTSTLEANLQLQHLYQIHVQEMSACTVLLSRPTTKKNLRKHYQNAKFYLKCKDPNNIQDSDINRIFTSESLFCHQKSNYFHQIFLLIEISKLIIIINKIKINPGMEVVLNSLLLLLFGFGNWNQN